MRNTIIYDSDAVPNSTTALKIAAAASGRNSAMQDLLFVLLMVELSLSELNKSLIGTGVEVVSC